MLQEKSAAYCPDGAHIEVDEHGTAFLIFDGIRTIRATSLTELLTQMRLTDAELEPA